MSARTQNRRSARVRVGGGALAAAGAVAAIAQMTAGAAGADTTAVADDGVPTNGSLTGSDNQGPADNGPVPVSDNGVSPVVTDNSDDVPTNGSLVGPPGVDKPSTPAPTTTPDNPTGTPPTATPNGVPVGDDGGEPAPTPVVEPGTPTPTVPEPSVQTPTADQAGPAPSADTSVTVTPAANPEPAQPVRTATQVSTTVPGNTTVNTTYIGGEKFASSDTTVAAPGAPNGIHVATKYDNGVRSADLSVPGTNVQASGVANPTDGPHPGTGGQYNVTGDLTAGGVTGNYTGGVNGYDNSTDGSLSVSVPNGPSVTVPVKTPPIPADLSKIPSPQQITNFLGGLGR